MGENFPNETVSGLKGQEKEKHEILGAFLSLEPGRMNLDRVFLFLLFTSSGKRTSPPSPIPPPPVLGRISASGISASVEIAPEMEITSRLETKGGPGREDPDRVLDGSMNQAQFADLRAKKR